ncbi:MAG: sigma-70 family RNA polymerase sigma factor [Solirubrobacterales bacterium]|nr:sigma-70 family RNA polymerase sigma factor [Solirubrobacterales bacterium]
MAERDRGPEFAAAVEPHRRALLVHCYRMLGSADEAEDLVQETMLRAWRAHDRYDPGLASFRTWLYRIATNACLNALEGRARRPLPSGVGRPFGDPDADFVPGLEVPWLQPIPDRLLGRAPEDPATLAAERSTVRLAVVAALQLLSAKQRAVLILRDVLGFSAAEVAAILDTSTAAVNSALQRARGAFAGPSLDAEALTESESEERVIVDRYVAAFERGDAEGLAQLLASEVVLEMPPMWNWYIGTVAYRRFMTRFFHARGCDWRTIPVSANRQPAMAAYRRHGDEYRLHTLQLFTVQHGAIARTTVYQDPDVFAIFELPRNLGDRDELRVRRR